MIMMERKITLYRLSLWLIACVMSASAWAQGGSGSGSEPFTIASKTDWQTFCNRIAAGEDNLNAKMTADVDLGTDIIMAGTTQYNYAGTFDGQGHTLKFDWTSEEGELAPFKRMYRGTIKNLRTQGKIRSNGRLLSGLICVVEETATISGCVSDVDIMNNDKGGPVYFAGMIAGTFDADITLTDCLVKGTFTATTDQGRSTMAGFICDLNGKCTLENCLYAGTNNSDTEGYTATFARGATVKNCYYVNTCGKEQGVQATAAQLASGEMTAKLQNGRASQVWGQAIGSDAQPLLTDNAVKRVHKVEFTYKNKVAAMRYANKGRKVQLPTAKEVLGTTYDATKTYTLAFDGGFSATTAIIGDMKVKVTVNSSTTGIDSVTGDATGINGAVYNLQGQCMIESMNDATRGSLPAGVYIINGRKFIVK